MENKQFKSFLILGATIGLGLIAMGFILGNAAITFKEYERTVTVKGLSEEEHMANVVIWPIQFTVASNELEGIYEEIDVSSEKVIMFLQNNGIHESEISLSTPNVTDKKAQQYGTTAGVEFRFVATQTITVYSENVEKVRVVMEELSELGKEGIAITGNDYMSRTEYLYTGLNQIKPRMIETATKEARAVAEKFAEDSNSELGKIKTAYQGQFSISPRDQNNPHIKKIRVVSTVVYYLSD